MALFLFVVLKFNFRGLTQTIKHCSLRNNSIKLLHLNKCSFQNTRNTALFLSHLEL